MPILLDLFCTFFRVGLLMFGGGYAMLPLLQKEIVEKKHWTTDEEILDYYAIGQITPGIIAVNTATFVGFKHKKVAGGVCATLGIISPSLIIITAIAALLSNFADIPAVQNAFAGIRVCVCVLILNSVIKLAKKAVIDKVTLVIFIAVAVLSAFTDLSPVIFVLLAAVLGIVLRVLMKNGKGEST